LNIIRRAEKIFHFRKIMRPSQAGARGTVSLLEWIDPPIVIRLQAAGADGKVASCWFFGKTGGYR